MSELAHHPDPNATLKAVRQSLLMSQAEFALSVRAAGQRAGEPNDCNKRLVQRWEAGTVTAPRGNYSRALEAVTGHPIENLGFKGADPGRRRVLGVAAAAVAAAAWALPEGKAQGARGPLTGIWRSRYEYASTGRAATLASSHYVMVIHRGDRLQVRSLPGTATGRVMMDLTVSGSVLTGTWSEETDPDGYYCGCSYHGAIQLTAGPSETRLAGAWVGFGKEGEINTGPWTLDLVSADTGTAAAEKFNRPVAEED